MASTSNEQVKRNMDEKDHIQKQLQKKKNEAVKAVIDDEFEEAKELVDECIDLKQQLDEMEREVKTGVRGELKKKIEANKRRTDEED